MERKRVSIEACKTQQQIENTEYPAVHHHM